MLCISSFQSYFWRMTKQQRHLRTDEARDFPPFFKSARFLDIEKSSSFSLIEIDPFSPLFYSIRMGIDGERRKKV